MLYGNAILMDNVAIVGKTGIEQGLQLCKVCGNYSIQVENPSKCPACCNQIAQREKHSLQKTWAFLITAALFILPANAYPITYLLKNNLLYPDTIFSGILSLIDSGMPGIALIVFIASIVVPSLKIIVLAVIALCVQFRWNFSPKKQ